MAEDVQARYDEERKRDPGGYAERDRRLEEVRRCRPVGCGGCAYRYNGTDENGEKILEPTLEQLQEAEIEEGEMWNEWRGWTEKDKERASDVPLGKYHYYPFALSARLQACILIP